MRRRRLLAASLGAAYLVGLAVVSLWPVHVDGPGGFLDVTPLLDLIARFGVPAWRSYPWVEFGGNVLMFVPFGVLVAIGVRRFALWLAPLFALLVSATFEGAQAVLLAHRTPDAEDVAAAVLGAFLGALVAWAIVPRRLRASTHPLGSQPR